MPEEGELRLITLKEVDNEIKEHIILKKAPGNELITGG